MSGERIPAALSALDPSYEILREIGRGGTAVVYLARERDTDTEVAIKLIRARYLEDEEAVGRFAREARFLERLVHPNIVRVRAVAELGDAGLAIVMAHVPGRSLKELILREGRLSVQRAERFTRDIARALGAAHAMGIVHRDVKPENIFIDAEDRPLLADFGLARSMSGDSQLTMAGVAIGTPAYMAPEQIEGASLDARGDIYSLGLVAWEMLTGHRPWEGESLYAVLYRQRYEQLPDVRDMRDDVPDALADAISTAIEKNPAVRWQNTDQLIEALDGAATPRRASHQPRMNADTVRFMRPVPGRRREASPPVADANPENAELSSPPSPQPLPSPVRMPTPTVELGPASLPPSRTVHESSFIDPSTLASLAAELDAQDEVTRTPRGRRYAIAAGGIAAVATLVLVAANLQGHANDARHPRMVLAPDFKINDSLGKSIAAGPVPKGTTANTSSGTVDSSVVKRPPVSPDPAVASVAPVPPSMPETRESPPPSRLPVSQQSIDRDKSAAKKPDATPPRQAEKRTVDNSSAKPGAVATAEKTSNAAPGKQPATSDNPAPVPQPETPPPAPVGVLSSRVTVSAGGLHSCMLSAEGRAFCWGGNDRGQLGAGTATSVSTPIAVAGDVRFSTIVAGFAHSCAIARGGGAWCWGENEHGQLGDRSTMAHQAPMRVADSRLFTTIAVGASHTCALDGQGEAFCWGSNSHGQVGSELGADVIAPTAVSGAHRFSSIALGWNFSCGIDGGRAYCWGENGSGQLGDGSVADRHTPVPVSGGLTFRTIAAGNTHACGITTRGEAYCWGNNVGGQLGDGTRVSRGVPAPVKTSLRFVAIAVGALHTCALTADDEAFCWGRDNYGQLGDGAGSQDSPDPVRVTGDHSFASIRAFGSHTCGTTTSGEAFCWGYNLDGQLGDGSRANRGRPVYVEPPPGT